MHTDRLELRLPTEQDRSRFVELFCDEAFMAFSTGVLDRAAAERRFDGMLRRAAELPFAKQPIVERSTQVIVGYAGVDVVELDGEERLELGWRLVPEARGRGYATEAVRAILEIADRTFEGEVLAIIDPTNTASQNVARKVGFTFWREAVIDGYVDGLHRLRLPRGAAAPR